MIFNLEESERSDPGGDLGAYAFATWAVSRLVLVECELHVRHLG